MHVDLNKAITELNAGHVVGIPTETVYGLAARIDFPKGIEAIFTTKQRPFFDPLIVHVHSAEQARTLVSQWPAAAIRLTERFWPGPLTIVLPKARHVSAMITSGLETVGLRCPNHPLALELLRELSAPLAAPSANRFGRTSPTTAHHVEDEFQGQVPVLDGGPCHVGIESTILAVNETESGTGLAILRKGSITAQDIQKALEGIAFQFVDASIGISAPGQIKHHYMPPIPLVFVRSELSEKEIAEKTSTALNSATSTVEGIELEKPSRTLSHGVRLELSEDPTQAARQLYARLRELSQAPADHIYFIHESFHTGEAWTGIMDRLERAAMIHLP